MSETLSAREIALNTRPVEEVLDPAVHERIMTAASFQEPDRVPIWDFIDSWPLYQRFAPGDTNPVTATAKVFNGLGIDMCRGVYLPLDPATAMTAKTHWAEQNAITSLEQLRSWDAPLPTEEQLWHEVTEAIRIRDTMAPLTLYVPGCGVGFHAAYGHMGLLFFSRAIYDARDDIERMIDTLNRASSLRAQAYAQAKIAPLFFIGDDIAYKGRTMFSLQMLRELFFPYLRRMCEPLVAAGIKVIFHTDGYVMEIIEDLLECGVSGLNPLEPLAGNDIPAIKKRYGRNLILVGGMDCSQLLPLGSVKDVIEGTKQLLRDAGHGGGFFIGSSSEIVPATPLANSLAFYEACKEWGRYPLSL